MDLLKEISWLGTFFPPDRYSERFSGRLKYTPGEGLLLNYLMTNESKATPPRSENGEPYLHGVLDSGEPCTLFRPVPSVRKRQFCGSQHSQSGTVTFGIMALGKHILPDQKFSNATVAYSGMQEFFYPTDAKDWEKFSPVLINTEPTEFGSASVFTTGSFEFLPDDPAAIFHSSDPDALAALATAIKDVEKQYPDQVLYVKKDIGYAFHLNFEPPLNLFEIRSRIVEISNLLALLTHKPVLPQTLALASQETPHEHVKIYLSLLRDRRTVEMSLNATSHHRLPINAESVKLSKLIGKWLENAEQFQTVADSLQNQTGVVNLRDLHGELVLNVALLESISRMEGKRSQRERYQYPVDRFASHWVKELLSRELGAEATHIGAEISEVRNEIVHFGKPRKLLRKLELGGLHRVNTAIRLIVLGYALESIGVPVRDVRNYQYEFLSR